MGVYIFLCVVIFLLQFKIFSNSSGMFRFSISMFLLLIVSTLRGNGNGDYFTYLEYSKLINTARDVFNNDFPMEIGFRSISYIVNIFQLNSQWVISIMNIISLSCLFIFIKSFSPNKCMSVFLFLPMFFMFDMHAARTAVAISISTLGFRFLLDNKKVKYILVICIASMFHKVAFIMIILLFIRNFKINRIMMLVSIPCAIIFVKLIPFYNILSVIFNRIGLYAIASKLLSYSTNSLYAYEFKLYDPRLILSIFILMYSLFISSKIKLTTIEKNLIVINWLLILMMIIFSKAMIFVTRIYGFMNIYSIIQLPIFLNKNQGVFPKEIDKFFLIIIEYVYIFYMFIMIKNYPEYIFFFAK